MPVRFSRNFLLEQERGHGDRRGGQPVAPGCSSRALPSGPHLAAWPCDDAEMLNPCPQRQRGGKEGRAVRADVQAARKALH